MKPLIFSVMFLCVLTIIGTESVWSQQQVSFECENAMNSLKDAEQKELFWRNMFSQRNRYFQIFVCNPNEVIQACLQRCNNFYGYSCYAHVASADAAQNRVYALVPMDKRLIFKPEWDQLVRKYWQSEFGELKNLSRNVEYWKGEVKHWCGEVPQRGRRRGPAGGPLLGVPAPPTP